MEFVWNKFVKTPALIKNAWFKFAGITGNIDLEIKSVAEGFIGALKVVAYWWRIFKTWNVISALDVNAVINDLYQVSLSPLLKSKDANWNLAVRQYTTILILYY